MRKAAIYLGDGAYVEFFGDRFELYTSDGIAKTNRVFLEPEAMQELVDFVERCNKVVR